MFRFPLVPATIAAVIAAVFITLLSPLTRSVFAQLPVITNVATSNLQTTSVTITWTTDVVATTQINYGLTTAYGSTTTLNSSLVTSHSQTITGLTANQLYHFQVASKDALGDVAVSQDRTFMTPLGSTSTGTATDSSNSNTINTSRIRTAAGGKVTSLSVYVGAVDPALANRNFQLAIYNANNTIPTTLVASTATGTLVANSWNTLPINATLAANTYYFLAYNTNGASASVNNMRYISGGTSGWSTADVPFGTWPANFGGFSTQSVTFSIYATFVSDVTAPQVSITSPLANESVSGTITISADASDDTAVSGVQFKFGGTDLGPVDTTAPYTATLDTSILLNAAYDLTAVATDPSGNSATSSAVTIQSTNPARLAIVQPTAGQTISGTSVTVTYKKMGDWTAGNGNHAHLRLDGGSTVMDFDADNNQSVTFATVPGGSHNVEIIVANGSHIEQPGSGGTVSFATIAPDTEPPTATITAPINGATVQNTVTVTADAADNVAVVGVQFLLDGQNLGNEDTTAPYSVSWDTLAAANGNHTLSARVRDSVNQSTSSNVTVTVANTDPRAVVGEWSSVMNWPLVAVHATMLHTGEVLMWDGWESPVSNAKLWNPTTNTFIDVPVTSGLFCSGHATLSNGELLVMGGHTPTGAGIKDVNIFNPITRSWTKKPDMQVARWYPSVTQMPDNRMLTLSGQIVQGTFTNTPEIYSPATGTTSTVPISTTQLREIQYPQTAVLPSGKVLAISAEHGAIMTFDPATNAWTQIGTTQVPYGAWTSFAPGKFLITGGGNTFNDYHDMADDPNAVASNRTAKILDMTSGTPVWSNAPDMSFGRSFHNVTMMPDGKAFAVGGATIISDFARAQQSTITAESYDSATNSWTRLADPAKPRMYHSISLLLPDGRILSAGGGRLAPATDQLNAQYYSPPYLFKGPRPTISSAPSTIGYNATLDLVSPEAASISKVSLVNLGSVTHTADWNQHFTELSFTRNGNTLTINTPASANIAPENYYMLFIVNSDGVPSVAKIVKLGLPDTTAPTISGVTSTNISSNAATITWTTNEAADSQIMFGTNPSYGQQTTLDTTLSLNHSQVLSGLSPNTTYYYQVISRDGSGNSAISSGGQFTTAALDATPPSVSITAPVANSTVSGVITINATASDNVSVAGVQFKIDGVNSGAEVTSSPYSMQWSSTLVANGTHTITAVARDGSGNSTTSTPISVIINNTGTNGLVAAYGFNETTGTTFSDSSGNGNNGTVFQATWNTGGYYGGALNFDGSNDYASVPDAPNLDLTTGMTLEAWVRPTASSGWRTVLLKENNSELAYALYARESTNRPSGWIRTNPTTGSSKSTAGTSGLPLNAWSHLATTYDGANLRLYVNGAQVATRAYTGSMYVSANPLKIGGNAVWGEYFAGRIDEVRIYNRALAPVEIQADMTRPL